MSLSARSTWLQHSIDVWYVRLPLMVSKGWPTSVRLTPAAVPARKSWNGDISTGLRIAVLLRPA